MIIPAASFTFDAYQAGQYGDHCIVHGDCRDVLPLIPDKAIDLVLTDPPYNAKNIGPNQRVYSEGIMQLSDEDYQDFCLEWFQPCYRISDRLVFTSGIANVCYYPQPYWIICWHKPAAVSFNRMGGFNAWEPIMVYGKSVKQIPQDYWLHNTTNTTKGAEAEHPCPKPLGLWSKIVDRFSREGELILDPMAGSGTTAIAARNHGRKSISIEIVLKYAKIAEQRLAQEVLGL
jgi:adenine-specific DNA-methyltransferase